jgi:hypothetical protein
MSFFIVDVETDGPAPGLYSMVSFAAVKVDEDLKTTFLGKTKPISEKWIPEALAIIEFAEWVKSKSKGRPVFLSDNLAFDWSFIS